MTLLEMYQLNRFDLQNKLLLVNYVVVSYENMVFAKMKTRKRKTPHSHKNPVSNYHNCTAVLQLQPLQTSWNASTGR